MLEQVGDILQAGLTIHSESCRRLSGKRKGGENKPSDILHSRHVSCPIYLSGSEACV